MERSKFTVLPSSIAFKKYGEEDVGSVNSAVKDVVDRFTAWIGQMKPWNQTIDEQCQKLVLCFERKQNDDNLKEILSITDPEKNPKDVHGWHLERMAETELSAKTADLNASVVKAVEEICRDCQYTSSIIHRSLRKGEEYQMKRRDLITSMKAQRDALLSEVEASKEELSKVHLTNQLAVTPNLTTEKASTSPSPFPTTQATSPISPLPSSSHLSEC